MMNKDAAALIVELEFLQIERDKKLDEIKSTYWKEKRKLKQKAIDNDLIDGKGRYPWEKNYRKEETE